MMGRMIIIEPGGSLDDPPEVIRVLTQRPAVTDLRAAVDGDLEIVPHWTSIIINGEPCTCVAFCDENAKRPDRHIPMNQRATMLWEGCLNRQGRSLINAHGNWIDYLVGPVVIITGDRELLEAL